MATLRVGRSVARWRVWSTSASVVVTEPDALALAREVVENELSAVPDGPAVPAPARRATSWRDVTLAGRTLTVPPGVRLDLGATAKALTADRCARLVTERLGTGVLVELGGDIATAGDGPVGGWTIHVQDRPIDPPETVRVTAGTAMATSSTASRGWRRGGRLLHHVLDPRTGMPSSRVWRSVTVCADRCVVANTHSTAALVRGTDAPPAPRLVDNQGHVHVLGGWPEKES